MTIARYISSRLRVTGVLAAAAFALSACGDGGNQVGGFSNDIMGNKIKIEALHDPGIPGVVCHLAYFERSALDRLRKGNWFEDPSNTSIACQRSGAISLKGVDLGRDGEEIFSQRESLWFKRIALRRIVDLENHTILYVSHSREVVEGSAKMSLSAVTLTDAEVATVKR